MYNIPHVFIVNMGELINVYFLYCFYFNFNDMVDKTTIKTPFTPDRTIINKINSIETIPCINRYMNRCKNFKALAWVNDLIKLLKMMIIKDNM